MSYQPPYSAQFGYHSSPGVYPQGYPMQPFRNYQAAHSQLPSVGPSTPVANSTEEREQRPIMSNSDKYATTSMLCVPSRTTGFATVATKVLWMLNLPNNCSKDDVKKVISQVGDVSSVEINEYRNYCFVTMKSRIDCLKVIKLLAKKCWINGCQVNMCYAKSRGMEDAAFSSFWDGRKGTMQIPWDALPHDISELCIGSYVDEDSLPARLRGFMVVSSTAEKNSQPRKRHHDVSSDVLLVRSPVYEELPLEVHSPVYGRDSPVSVHSPVYGLLPLEVCSPVYSDSHSRVTSPARKQIEVLEVSSPVYSESYTRDRNYQQRDSVRSRHRHIAVPVYRGKSRSRSRSPHCADPRFSTIGYRAPRFIQNKPQFERRTPNMSMNGPKMRSFPHKSGKSDSPKSPPPLREVDKTIFDVKESRDVSFRSTAILDDSVARRAPRGRGNAMAFASCTFTSAASDTRS